jgi:tetratricopeptide (TPR) repeat protein
MSSAAKSLEFYLQECRTLFNDGKYARAIVAGSEGSQYFPESAELIVLISECYFLLNDSAKAKELIKQGFRRSPNHSGLGRRMLQMHAEEIIEKIRATDFEGALEITLVGCRLSAHVLELNLDPSDLYFASRTTGFLYAQRAEIGSILGMSSADIFWNKRQAITCYGESLRLAPCEKDIINLYNCERKSYFDLITALGYSNEKEAIADLLPKVTQI